MGLNRNREAYIDGGIGGILLFLATLTGVEEDIPNDFDSTKLRARIDFKDVEIIESEDAVALDDENFHFFFTQSNKKGSVSEKVVNEYDDFAQNENIEGIAIDNLEGMRVYYARRVAEFGKNKATGEQMNSAKYWVPVGLDGADLDKIKASLKGGKAGKSGGGKAAGADELQAVILEAAGMGETEAGIKKAIKSASSDARKAVSGGGGLTVVLTSLVETSLLTLEDGVYTTA